jgi:alkylation response protein AidB-like acyl-CoA dehydrogenase
VSEITDDFQAAVRRFIRAATAGGEPDPAFAPEVWRGLGEMGVLGIAAPGSGGTPADVCRCLFELGAAGVVGPLVETVMATSLLSGADADAVGAGRTLASVVWEDPDGSAVSVPFGDRVEVVVAIGRSGRAHRAFVEDGRLVATLAGESWARGRLAPGEDLGPADTALALGELAIAAYLVGAGLRAVEISAEYAAARRQFGRPIGDYQGVAHPLAQAWAELEGLREFLVDLPVGSDAAGVRGPAPGSAALRLLAQDAATSASYSALQVHGGMGFVRGTWVTQLAARIRQVSLTGVPKHVSERRAWGSQVAGP